MKKFILLTLVLIHGIFVQSQENWSLTPSLGLNMILFSQDDFTGNQYKAGFNAALTVNQKINEKLSMSYGLALNRRFSSYYYEKDSEEFYDLIDLLGNPILDLILSGFDLTVYNSTYSYSTLWTLDLPITLNYTFEKGILIYGGGYVNYLLAANNSLEYEKHVPVFEVIDPESLNILGPEITGTFPKNETSTSSNSSKSGFNEIDYGLLAGVGYTTNNWIVKLSYQYGLNDIRSDAIEPDMDRHTAFQLSLGYTFSKLFSTSKEKPIYDLELIK